MRAADFSKKLAELIIENGLPEETFLNVNIPSGSSTGVQFTRQGKRRYGESVVSKQDPRGRKYYWIGGAEAGFDDIPGSDCNALQQGLISVTPLRTNMTNEETFDEMKRWPFDSKVGEL